MWRGLRSNTHHSGRGRGIGGSGGGPPGEAASVGIDGGPSPPLVEVNGENSIPTIKKDSLSRSKRPFIRSKEPGAVGGAAHPLPGGTQRKGDPLLCPRGQDFYTG